MALLPKNLDYTDRDFDSLRLRMRNLVRSVFPEWTDFNVANFGSMLVELYSFVGDVLTFYQDNQANEAFMVTATQRKNIINLAKQIGFSPAGASAATVDETFTLSAPPLGDVIFPAGTIVKTADITDPVRFQLLADLTIPALTSPPRATATVENSETVSESFTSSGLPNQAFLLSSNPYVDDSATIVANDGTYTPVVNFLDSNGTDKHFTISIDQNDRATIQFGNGVNGKIPVGTIIVTSKSGGGTDGNVEAAAVKVLEGSFVDTLGNPQRVTVTNVENASGGIDRQSNAEIQLLAPASLRVLERTVAREDFEINALKIPGVARALMTTSNEDAGVPENTGILYVVPAGGGVPSQALKDSVKGQFISTPTHTAPFPSTLTFIVRVQDPLYLVVDVQAVVWFSPGLSPAVGAARIRTALASFFALTTIDPVSGETIPNTQIDFGANYKDADGNPLGPTGGATLGLGDIFDVVHDTAGVLRVGGSPSDFLLNGGHTDLPILAREFPQLGSVRIINGENGQLV
jgi:hypothetical protein